MNELQSLNERTVLNCAGARILSAGLIGCCGVLAAALLHIMASAFGWTITGEALPTSYAHILVVPLLLIGAIGSIAAGMSLAVRGRTSTERRALVRAAARGIVARSAVETAFLVLVIALATLTVSEAVEQLASGQALDPWPLLALGSLPFCALLLLVAFAIAGYMRFVLFTCVLAVALVAAIFGTFFSSHECVPQPLLRSLGDVSRYVHLLVSNVASWRGPPTPSSAT